MKMKSYPPSPQHLALRNELIALIRKHGETLRTDEILAVAAYMVGQIIALQDQRTMTPSMAMEIVAANIEEGNQQAQMEVKSAGGIAQ